MSGTSTLTFLLISARIDFDVNFFRVRRVGFQISSHAIVESHAEREKQIRFLNRRVDPRFAMHPHHAERQRMGRRKTAEAEQRFGHGNAGFFREARSLLASRRRK